MLSHNPPKDMLTPLLVAGGGGAPQPGGKMEEEQATYIKREKLDLLDEDTNIDDEQAPHQPWHTRILRGMVTGVGFLSDAYDLYVSLLPLFALLSLLLQRFRSFVALASPLEFVRKSHHLFILFYIFP